MIGASEESVPWTDEAWETWYRVFGTSKNPGTVRQRIQANASRPARRAEELKRLEAKPPEELTAKERKRLRWLRGAE